MRETRLDLDDFVFPLFVGPTTEPNPDLPALGRHAVEDLGAEADELERLGVRAVLLFGIPHEKDAEGSGAWDEDGVVQQALRALREASPGLLLLTDVCLCEYTSHGHCGVLDGEEIDNDATLDLLARTALSHVEAGADAVCPSDMMDGRVGAIRSALDEAGREQTPIVSYAAKYASAFYGPFREAAGSAPAFGDRRGYQMDPGERPRGAARVRAGRARGRRRADRQAGPAEPRRDPGGARALRPAGRRVQRLGRVRDGEGLRRARLDRRAAGRASSR